MNRRRCMRLAAVAVISVALQAGCQREAPAAPDPTPRWIVRQTPQAKVALVYVHGVTGDMVGTWTAADGTTTFFNLVDEHPATHGKADAFVFGFPSYIFKAGSFDIREAANRLHLHLQSGGVLDYPTVVFVAHSMGGLVVMRELLTHREVMKKVPVVVFYATPMEGAVVAAIGKEFSPNSALAQMTDADGNALLQSLNDDWRSVPDADRPRVRCAYEKTTVGPLKVVPWTSAARFCEGAPPAIEANHITIVKPASSGADAILVLVNALNDYVLGKALEAKLETPDFTTEGGNAVFTIHNALGKESARLLNRGGSPLNFTIAEISDPTALLLWPDNTPQDIGPLGEVRLGIALSRAATGNEYHFTLRTPIAPDRKVIVRVPDLQAVRAQQADVARSMAADMQAILADPGKQQSFAARGDEEGREALVQIARTAVAREAPTLPESAQWVLAADLLNAANWPTLASRALKNAEKASPSAARNPGVRHLAGIVAAQSGEKQIFTTGPTPPATSETLAAWEVVQPLTEPSSAGVATTLATSMQQVPALKAFGYSLEGDLRAAKGDAPAARAAYSEAIKIRPTPSVTRRFERSQSVNAVPPRAVAVTPGKDPGAERARRAAQQPGR